MLAGSKFTLVDALFKHERFVPVAPSFGVPANR
jgi:hypothetical protein